MPFLDRLSNDFQQTAGTDKAIAGEFAGARTTSTEYQGVMNQAMKPALEDAEYIADQILPWLATEVITQGEFYCDPARIIQITRTGKTEVFKPSELYGEFKTKVVSIGQFEADVLRRQEETAFISAAGPLVLPLMGKKGQIDFWKDVMRHRKFENVDRFFPVAGNYEAERAAWAENQLILWQGGEAVARPEENHETHIPVHERYLDNYMLLPQGEQDPERIRRMQLMIQMHQQMQAQAQQAIASAAAQASPGTPNAVGSQVPAEGGPAAPQQTGEAAGDMIGGMMGGQAQ
jgi:hypothetical protein